MNPCRHCKTEIGDPHDPGCPFWRDEENVYDRDIDGWNHPDDADDEEDDDE